MPIERVPVVHKFGIISHSQRLELQERLLKQSYLQATAGTRRAQTPTRSPLEVTEEFVQQFNGAEGLEQRERLEGVAYKMLHRIKRRAGLKDGGKGSHVDLPVAWTELSQLAQCKGKIQEDCLDVLITSLDQGPLERVHIPALFFLAETTLYWLRTDAVQQPYLRTGELKLLRMGQLVFTRLFFHHMAGQLQGHDDFKNRLYTYLDGFAESQEAYNPYPNALLSMRYINEVGKMVIGDSNTEAGEVKEGDNIQQAAGFPDPMRATPSEGRQSSQSGAISSSVHDLSPTLWHALDVWRCVHQRGSGLNSALAALASCGMGLASESWVDAVCALLVLADAAKASLPTLRTLHSLARGAPPPSTPQPPTQHSTYTPTHDMLQTEPGTGTFAYSPGYSSEEVSSRKTTGELQEDVDTGSNKRSSRKSQVSTSPTKPQSGPSPTKTVSIAAAETASPQHGQQQGRVHSRSHKTQESQRSLATDTVPNTAFKVEVGSDLMDGRVSQTSSVPTYTNQPHPELAGLHSWHWEVAITYADVLADICLHGSTSHIQKLALVGAGVGRNGVDMQQCPLASCGLLDLVYFRAAGEASDGGPNDWSWRVRYAAMQGLVKLCRSSPADPNTQGLRTAAWSTLVHAHSRERDSRVLEALKVGQVDASIESLLNEHLAVPISAIGAKIAYGLSRLYLPPLPAPVEPPTPRRHKAKPKEALNKPVHIKPMRTSLREEIMLATALNEQPSSFNTRTTFDLRRIVEDQWRKELQGQLDEEEEGQPSDIQELHQSPPSLTSTRHSKPVTVGSLQAAGSGT